MSDSLCQFAVATGEPLVVADARADALVRDMPPVRTAVSAPMPEFLKDGTSRPATFGFTR